VPHRQFVFTIPKRLRIYFRFDRQLLGPLCRAAWRVVRAVYHAASDHPEAVPGMIGAIQTFGDLIHAHSHIHALVAEGVFLPEGTFVPLPKLATEPFLRLWEQEVFTLLLAEVTQHVADPGEHLIRYYGFYSNKSRGLRAKEPHATPGAEGTPAAGPSAKEARKRWAALLKQVYEVDPLLCPKCGAQMKIIAFIEAHQSEVIEKILRHWGLWEEPSARAPPTSEPVVG